MTVTDAFIALVQGPERALPLDHAALLLAAHASPGMDVGVQLDRLDELAGRCPEPSLEALCYLLFEDMAFSGDTEDYSDPRNSFLDKVLDRRVGIPISLSVLMIEVGRRLGVPLEGVGMPGHFLVRHLMAPRVLIDPFHGGQLLDDEECANLFTQLYGADAKLPDAALEGVSSRAILARMLANLKRSYLDRRDPAGLLWVGRLRAAIPGVARGELLELARVLVSLAQFGEAANVLEELAGSMDGGGASLRAQARALRARLN